LTSGEHGVGNTARVRGRAGVRDILRRILRNDHLLLLFLALVVGIASAYGAILFVELYLSIQWLGFGTNSSQMIDHAAMLPAWQRVAVPAGGGLVIGLMVRYFMPGRRPHGVPDVIESVALRAGSLGTKAGIGAAVISAASIGAGASVGREGPVVHLGATLASQVGEKLRLSRSQTVTLLGCGVAAAVSASFNTPIAGVFFALEVVIGHYALSAFAPIVIASVVGTMISRAHFGDFPAFVMPEHAGVSALEFPAFALLGILSAVTAIVFLKGVTFTQKTAARVPVPPWSRPMFAGILVGLIALAFPQVLGVGYGTTDAAIRQGFTFEFLILLLVAKTAATALSLGGGFGGGVFSPSLFLGAMLGAAFGILATDTFPQYSTGPSAYTLVGMGAVAGSVLGAPISTILIIFELSADYGLTIAVMVGVVVASVITQQVHGRSFFLGALEARGVNLRAGQDSGLLEQIQVRDLMSDEYAAAPVAAGMAEVRELLMSAPHSELFVIRTDGALFGTITLSDLSEAAFDTSLDHLLKAGDVALQHPPFLRADDTLERALTLMRGSGEEHIGVVENDETMKLVGFIHEVDVMVAYNRALMEARREERGQI